MVANTPAYFFVAGAEGEEGLGISWCGSGWDGRTAAAGEVTSWGLQSLAVETPKSKVNSESILSNLPGLVCLVLAVQAFEYCFVASKETRLVPLRFERLRDKRIKELEEVRLYFSGSTFFSVIFLPHWRVSTGWPALPVQLPLTILVHQNWRPSRVAVHSLATMTKIMMKPNGVVYRDARIVFCIAWGNCW